MVLVLTQRLTLFFVTFFTQGTASKAGLAGFYMMAHFVVRYIG